MAVPRRVVHLGDELARHLHPRVGERTTKRGDGGVVEVLRSMSGWSRSTLRRISSMICGDQTGS
jgi:hypothetical protein